MKTLTEIESGKEVLILGFAGGRGMRSYLAGMGLRVNQKVKLVSKMGNEGPLMVQFGESKIVLGHGMARKITVKSVDPE